MSGIEVDHANCDLNVSFLEHLEVAWAVYLLPSPHDPITEVVSRALEFYRKRWNKDHSPNVTPYHAIRCLRVLATTYDYERNSTYE